MSKTTRIAIFFVLGVVAFIFMAIWLAARGTPPSSPSGTVEASTTEPSDSTTTARPSPAQSTSAATNPAPAPSATSDEGSGTDLSLRCGPNPITAQMVEKLQPDPWMDWIRQLSGVDPVVISGEETRITSRFTQAMFGSTGEEGLPNARAFKYVLQTVRGWYPEQQIEVQTFSAQSRGGDTLFGKNLILSLPGVTKPEEVVILSAHLDSTSNANPTQTAPGAEDNGSGSAALLEAARLFREMRFERTLRIIWFTGEEQGLLGSKAYLSNLADAGNINGVINLDMFGYDSDDDRCFEVHAGTLPASEPIGRCFIQSAQAYQQDLNVFDYLTAGAIGASDHGTFWEQEIGAIEILENMFDNNLPDGCANADHNQGYHSPQDTVDQINPETGIRIVRAALATVAAMAGPVP